MSGQSNCTASTSLMFILTTIATAYVVTSILPVINNFPSLCTALCVIIRLWDCVVLVIISLRSIWRPGTYVCEQIAIILSDTP